MRRAVRQVLRRTNRIASPNWNKLPLQWRDSRGDEPAMLRVGLIGWRGMVGSVLLQRMREENDFAGIEPVFFSTSNAGGEAPREAGGAPLKGASSIRDLAACDVLISCQGGEYTTEIYKPL